MVKYRTRIISYKCITGFANQGWADESLPSSSSLYTHGNIDAGQRIVFNDSIGLSRNLEFEQFTFEV